MRYINSIIVHRTTAGDEDKYHYIIEADGKVVRSTAISQPGRHCRRHNAHSIAVAYTGDGVGDVRTPAQRQAMLQLLSNLIIMYRCKTFGHRDFDETDCPGFDVEVEYGRLYQHLVLGRLKPRNGR